MYRIAILLNNEILGRQLVDWTKQFYKEQGKFPLVEMHRDSQQFFQLIRDREFDGVIIGLPGVEGLNAVEHLRSLVPDCQLIWCSDLDFSLHAYRLRVEYFILNPVTDEELRRGLSCWMEYREYWKKKQKKEGQG